jgi:hypothetical protein
MENLLDFLKLMLRRLGVVFVCLLLITLCFNELEARHWFPANPLKNTPLAGVNLRNLLAGPKNWSLPNQKTLSEAAAKLPAPILKLAGQASPAGALSASYSSGVATPSSDSTVSAAASTPSAELLSPDQWQKIQQELGQVWDRTKTTVGALQTFIKTQLFAPAPTASQNGSASASVTAAPLEQRTIEYAKYLYCKETVSAYEKLNPGVVSPAPVK